ncbi:T9SS type A sorting domain-containing protein [Kordia sp.]|uniref:T9SS type A sorting domain-containing protein n=1 Tax=Kordia sp. TaxID=1965332 RepID=UPI003D2C20D0
MKFIQILIITTLLWMCSIFSAHAQYNPTLNATIGNNGLVEYEIAKAGTNTFIFTLFGDGTFSTLTKPTHIFDKDTVYKTEVYFARSYDPNIPPRKTIQVTPNITPGIPNPQANPTVNMTGEIDLMTSWATAVGHETFYIIAFRNTTSQNAVNGIIEFSYHSDDLQVNTNNIKIYNNWATPITPTNLNTPQISLASSYNEKLTWSFTNLAYDEIRYIYVPATTLRMTGDKLNLEVKYAANGQETIRQQEFLTRRYPHDPNFKIVNKEYIKPGLNQQQELIYTVGYFNDGENYARNVYVKDVLPSSLDHDKITLLDYEVQPTWYTNRGIIYFDFLNINLPGTNQTIPNMYSYDQASTYFSFKICTKTNLTDCILNTASIVFDSQPIFYTNTSKICTKIDYFDYTICGGNSALRNQGQAFSQLTNPMLSDELTFDVYPNPASNKINFNIQFNSEKASNFSITLYDYSGKIIKELVINQHDSAIFKNSFDVHDIASGFYFMTLKTQQNQYTKKIIKH